MPIHRNDVIIYDNLVNRKYPNNPVIWVPVKKMLRLGYTVPFFALRATQGRQGISISDFGFNESEYPPAMHGALGWNNN